MSKVSDVMTVQVFLLSLGRPFAWTASADSILQKIARLCSRIYGTLGVATRIAQDKSPATHSPSSRNINAVRRADVDARYFCVNLNGA
jgi:hypothetical protein